MNYSWLNLGSVLLGLCAWAAPMLYASRRVKGARRSGLPCGVSLGCCGMSLWFQLLYSSHLAAAGDVAALLDTADAVAKVSGFLLITTVLLNAAILWCDRPQGPEGEP